MKYVLLLTLIIASLLFAAEFKKEGGDHVYRDTVQFDEPAAGLDLLDCSAVNGEIELTGEDRSTISVTANVKIEADDLEEGQRFLKEFKPVVKRNGTKLEVYAEYPESDKGDWDGINASIDFIIHAPKSLSLDASCANGEITATGMTGDADLSSANGEISFISKDGITGAIDASCANGEINIDVASLTSNCEFSTANGEIKVNVRETLAGNISASTANGEITLALPENSSMKVSASSLSGGSIESEWKGNLSDNLIGDEFEVTVNEGKYLVDCSSVNGEIDIRKSKK
jgi:DUF4097 and DUF4098 domain-containing protein YvlB